MRLLIIGGVAGGASSAVKARRTREDIEIIIFERNDYISYANCGMPYYVGNIIKDRDDLLVVTPQYLKKRFNIDVRTRNEVIKIKGDEKKIVVKDLVNSKIYDEKYDKLIISTGASPILPPSFKGENVFTLYNLEDMDKIKGFIENNRPKKALVLGGGFIGIEMAENFQNLGMDVTICEKADQILLPFDREMAKIAEEYIEKTSVKIIKNKGVAKIEEGMAYFEDGTHLDFDIALVSLGVKPNSGLAKDAGLDLGIRDTIKVNEYMETSVKDIYAAGDVAENFYAFDKSKTWIPLAGSANKQGRIAGYNSVSSGEKKIYKGTLGTAIAKFGEITFACTGYNEKTLKERGVDYISCYLVSESHASYYPSSREIYIKLLGDRDGKVLGAQVLGFDGVDKRVDVFATAIYSGLTFEDLESLDLAYAPPFSSAKDPVIVAGMIGNNIARKEVSSVTSIPKNSVILDVRTRKENTKGSIENAINIPIDEIREKADELNNLKDKKIIVHCATGYRSYIVSKMLKNKGFRDVSNLSGGYFFYKKNITSE
ncbi:MAG: FAD-dependent oxidoreductase [Proteobacteria bacterium]|nr:FAD-dependent oxidoreductase [Pseudomonadota bacterium]